ncbi:ubiquinol-cytochrome c reductase iron-sulfur subunit [Halocatena marina]|uniref:Ubiquinol-cytochrome c reductase iron-sulfur subunit n=1 Tax=Halocatena marina TaxID=2934937 RepID=A0ABD5YS72_9EURY|nr:ubiquinol-cytochrome c reductase iron-sulfur subunit [Halocatena marina]
MADSDKYPIESGRRRFVKGVVGAASLATVGTATGVGLTSVTSSAGEGGGVTRYKALENIAGPAPRGMPQIPIEIDGSGTIKGIWPEPKEVQRGSQTITVAETDIGGVTYSTEWFQYCGVQTYAGIAPDADQENSFLSGSNTPYSWQQEQLSSGDPLKVEHFQDYKEWGNDIGKSGLGKPAMGTWRSKDTKSTIPIQVIRSTKVEEMAKNDPWLKASTAQGFIAWLDKCTHFCCVPAYKAFPGSAKFNAEDKIYCQCHQSVYDPYQIVDTTFVSLPRPSGDSGSESGSESE